MEEKEKYEGRLLAEHDPYIVYYLGGETPFDKESYEDEMFDYLRKKYPDYFG